MAPRPNLPLTYFSSERNSNLTLPNPTLSYPLLPYWSSFLGESQGGHNGPSPLSVLSMASLDSAADPASY